MSDGVIVQCVRVDHMASAFALAGSAQVACASCRQRVWLSKTAVQLARTEGIKPVCNVCRPAKQVGPITPGK